MNKSFSKRLKWLTILSIVYFAIGMIAIFTGYGEYGEIIQFVWILTLSLPLWISPLGRWLEMDKPIPKDQW